MEQNTAMYKTLGYATAGLVLLWFGISAAILLNDKRRLGSWMAVKLEKFIVTAVLPQLESGSEAYNVVASKETRDEILAAWAHLDAHKVSIDVDDDTDTSTIVTVKFMDQHNKVIEAKHIYHKVHTQVPGLLHK